MSNQQISLDDAVNSPSLRQDYLIQLCGNQIPYWDSVSYDPNCIKASEWLAAQLRKLGAPEKVITYLAQEKMQNATKHIAGFPMISPLLGSGIRAPIFVGERFFRLEYNEGEHLSILRDHEGTHLRQVAEGVKFLDTNTLKHAWIKGNVNQLTAANILELEANYESLLSIQKGNSQVRTPFFQEVLRRYQSGLSSLYNLHRDSQSKIERELIQQTLDVIPHKKV